MNEFARISQAIIHGALKSNKLSNILAYLKMDKGFQQIHIDSI
jgi:hypothetical protein